MKEYEFKGRFLVCKKGYHRWKTEELGIYRFRRCKNCKTVQIRTKFTGSKRWRNMFPDEWKTYGDLKAGKKPRITVVDDE